MLKQELEISKYSSTLHKMPTKNPSSLSKKPKNLSKSPSNLSKSPSSLSKSPSSLSKSPSIPFKCPSSHSKNHKLRKEISKYSSRLHRMPTLNPSNYSNSPSYLYTQAEKENLQARTQALQRRVQDAEHRA